MKYYIFKVLPSVGDPYYILNNQYIGYVGFDSDRVRSVLEHEAGIKNKYQRWAESSYIKDNSPSDNVLHTLNCSSFRFDEEGAKGLVKTYKEFKRSRDKTIYTIHYPNRNSSESYLKGTGKNKNKTIK